MTHKGWSVVKPQHNPSRILWNKPKKATFRLKSDGIKWNFKTFYGNEGNFTFVQDKKEGKEGNILDFVKMEEEDDEPLSLADRLKLKGSPVEAFKNGKLEPKEKKEKKPRQRGRSIIWSWKRSRPSCSKLTMSLVNVSLKLLSLNIAYSLIFFLKNFQ